MQQITNTIPTIINDAKDLIEQLEGPKKDPDQIVDLKKVEPEHKYLSENSDPNKMLTELEAHETACKNLVEKSAKF